MRITYLLTWGDFTGGTERAVLTQADALAGRHEVTVVGVFRTGQEAFERPAGITAIDLIDISGDQPVVLTHGRTDPASAAELAARPSRLVDPRWEAAFNELSDRELAGVLADVPADVVVTTTPALLAIAAQLVPDGVPIVHQEHRSSEFRGRTREPLDAFGPAADLVVFLAEPTRRHFSDQWGPVAPPTAVIGNGLARDIRPRSTLDTDLIVMSARLVPQKQPDHAVRAFAAVADANPTWRLRLVGDGPAAARTRRLIRELGLSDRVQLVGRTRNMPLQWASASIGLLTSLSEGHPLVIPEAFAAGVPFVSYDCPHGPRALITHGDDGLLVPANDIAALAEALQQLMGDADLRDRLGTAALASAAQLSPDRLADTWSDAFAAVVAGHPARPPRAARRMSAPGSAAAAAEGAHVAPPADPDGGDAAG